MSLSSPKSIQLAVPQSGSTRVHPSPNAVPQATQLRELQQKLLRAITSFGDKDAALTAASLVVSEVLGPVQLVYLDRAANSLLEVHVCQDENDVAPPSGLIESALLAAGNAACDQGHQHIAPVSTPNGALVSAAPVIFRGRLPEAIALVLPQGVLPVESLSCVTQLLAVHFILWHILQGALASETETRTLAAVLELLGKLETAADLPGACHSVVEAIQSHLSCQRVALGLLEGTGIRCRLRAVSGVSRFDSHSAFSREIETALDESVARSVEAHWPAPVAATNGSVLALRALCTSSQSAAGVSSPLKNQQGEVIGAWIILGSREVLERPDTATFLRACQASLGSCLQLWQHAERGVFYRLTRRLTGLSRSWRSLTIIGAAIALAVVLAFPVSYKVSCDCTLQPVTRRYVAAPFAGILEKSVVAPGDLVQVGDTLARLDGREIRLEMAGVTADYNRARKQSDAARATHQLAEAQQAKLEMERLDLKTRLLTDRAKHLEIKSPLAGIIVSGDLERAEGVPVSIGQTLFEVAPLQQMTLELAVPEDELAYVDVGAAVQIRLDAYPGEKRTGQITRIHPRAELRNGGSVFVAELTLDNSEGRLRPGMNGTGKIAGPRRPLAWNLFHKAWEKAVTAIAW